MGVLLRRDRASLARAGTALDVRPYLGLPGVGLAFHLWWCRKHGIDPLTAEPKERYYELRGWGRP